MKIEIFNRWSLKLIFSHEAENNTLTLTTQAAVRNGISLRGADLRSANLCSADLRSANLCGADLSGANLRGADLRSANLCGADLRSADLCGADLCGANLSGANLCSADLRSANLSGADLCSADLRGANLRRADLRSANLCGADLRSADLRSADLSGANLRSADLCGANLCDANLRPIKADFIEVISQAPHEVPALIAALKGGRVDGSTYTGDCACLVGTLANARKVHFESSEFKIPHDASRPVERFFMAIKKGDTPETNGASAIALEWAETWYATVSAAFLPPAKVFE